MQRSTIRLLQPWLVGDKPSRTNKHGDREWDMLCPLHDDSKRSASLNVDQGLWFCNVCGGGRVSQLLQMSKHFIAPDARSAGSNGSSRRSAEQPEEIISEAQVAGWASHLLSNTERLDDFVNQRGITPEIISRYEIGFDPDKKVYTIPVRGQDGSLLNVRRYNLNPGPTSTKIWSIKGMSPVELYPFKTILDEPEFFIICEGELDGLRTIQEGYPAITRTAGADVWKGEWSEHFAGKRVYVCNDRDDKGDVANRKLTRMLGKICDLRIVTLPYPHTPKRGKDLTDFWQENDADAFEELLAQAERVGKTNGDDKESELETVTVLDSFDARRAGEPVELIVTIKGRKEPGYLVPSAARMVCTRDAGAKCAICPMNAAGGDHLVEIDPDDPIVLGLIDTPTPMVKQQIAESFGVPGGRCGKLQTEYEGQQSVEMLFARPSIDHSDGTKAADYKSIKVTHVGKHDTMANTTVSFTGALQANPKTQTNEFQAWDVRQLETSVDHFEVTDEVIKELGIFRAKGKQRPLKKLGDISRELAESVTLIYGRPEMHALMDLVFHSPLAFNFGGQFVSRGWLEAVIVGDTRTGKSEAAHRIIQHYRAGELISCESATFAGVIGGVQQLGGKDWVVTWGVVPINDKRLVVLDEISGLTTEEISQMSEVRSSGVAKLTKIQQEATLARTRLLWLGNPRNAKMFNYTYGVDALGPLIGNTEDIARFDLAMALRMDDVPSEEINRPHRAPTPVYTSDLCHQLLMWAWTRQPDDIKWGRGAEKRVYELAQEMGKRYIEEPPLVQVANVRIKIARVAVALALRTFNTPDGHKVEVMPEHAEDAVIFMDRIYQMETFGYAARSQERINDREEAIANKKTISEYLKGRPTLAKYLRSTGKFRRQDLEEVLSVDRQEANAVINTLWEARMVYKDLGDIRVEPTLHELLRSMK